MREIIALVIHLATRLHQIAKIEPASPCSLGQIELAEDGKGAQGAIGIII